jgi:phthiocerol/phenolphthiocerol synthesis type-I polyketide synthase E
MVAPYLAGPVIDAVHPPVPPNIAYFLDHGLREVSQWFVPLLLRLPAEATVHDASCVLTAVTNHHDALRLQIVERAGAWEQHIAEPGEFTQLFARSLPQDVAGDGAAERKAIMAMLAEIVAEEDLSTPVTAVYITGAHGAPGRLALAVHHMACDDAARAILIDDIGTAFAQRLAGKNIALSPATVTWREWSQRCAALATHPAILESRDVWLNNSSTPTLRVADHDITERPRADDLARLCAPMTSILTAELDGAASHFGLAADELLLAALGRTLARTIGEGVVHVDLAGDGRSVLEPYVDLHRTVGWFSTIYPVPLACLTGRKASATQLVAHVHRTLAAVPHQGIGRGLLQYVYAPTALHFAARPPSDVFFSYVGAGHELSPGEPPIELGHDPAMPVRETPPGLGHALELRAYRADGLLQLDWWYDTRRIERSTTEELSEQFPLALIELTSEAIPPIDDAAEFSIADIADRAFALADASTLDIA